MNLIRIPGIPDAWFCRCRKCKRVLLASGVESDSMGRVICQRCLEAKRAAMRPPRKPPSPHVRTSDMDRWRKMLESL